MGNKFFIQKSGSTLDDILLLNSQKVEKLQNIESPIKQIPNIICVIRIIRYGNFNIKKQTIQLRKIV